MSEDVRELGQRFMAAAWSSLHAHSHPGHAAVLEGLLGVLEETEAQLAGLRLRLLHEARMSGADRVVDRARSSTRATTAQATASLKLSWDLAERFPVVGQALEDGQLSMSQAEAIVHGLKRLPHTITGADLARCQSTVLGYADVLGPSELRVLAARMTEVVDPAGAEQAEADRLARDERRARAGRFLRLRPDHHGSMLIQGSLPLADGALLAAQIDALMPPLSSYRAGDELPGPEARRADALILLTQHAATAGGLPAQGLDRPVVKITIPLTSLTTGHGAAGVVEGGAAISAGDARRLACDADIIPVVLGGPSEVLDVGRTRRLFPKALRTALTLRDQGCAFPHCTVAPAGCEAHHITPWWAGGETKLSHGVLLCPWHHRLVEPDPGQSAHSQWRVHLDADTGLPWFTPPRHIDPDQRPRQHRRFLLAGITITSSPVEGPPRPEPWAEPSGPADAAAVPSSEKEPRRTSGAEPCAEIAVAVSRPNPWHPDE
ncbi:MAG: DUF222 domain-containing protein [Arachnia sp.]